MRRIDEARNDMVYVAGGSKKTGCSRRWFDGLSGVVFLPHIAMPTSL